MISDGLSSERRMTAPSLLTHLIDFDEGSPLFQRIVRMIPAQDVFVVQMTCHRVRRIISDMFTGSGGVKTMPSGVVSSVERFNWVRTFGEDAPAWLKRWDVATCATIASGGGL